MQQGLLKDPFFKNECVFEDATGSLNKSVPYTRRHAFNIVLLLWFLNSRIYLYIVVSLRAGPNMASGAHSAS